MEWIKQEPIEGGIIGCLCCGHTPDILPLDTQLYQLFGGWEVFKNDETYYIAQDEDECKTLSEIEREAAKDPDNDWQAEVNLPLRSATYQRHGDDKWVLVKKGEGFA